MTTFTEGRHAGECIVSEANGTRSRETVTLAASQDLEAGTVLGRLTGTATAVGAAVAGNTAGSGAITAAPTTSAGVKAGVYRLVCIEPGTNAGKFLVSDPDGIVIGVATAATEFSGGGLTFTIADATDFASGDAFTITVTIVPGAYTQFNQDGTDGSQIAVGILIYGVTTGQTTAPCVILARDAEVNGAELTWPADIETAEKTAAIAQLAARGLIVR